MKVIKQLTTQVDIDDMAEMFSGDLSSVIMKHLEDRFIGRCNFSCLVTKIVGVTRQSDLRINPMSGTGQGYVNVEFDVEAIEYGEGEGLLAEIKEINDTYNYIHLEKDDNTAINMRRSKALRVAKSGQTIPVRVVRRNYQINKTMISVTSVLYLLPQDPAYIFLIDPLTKEEKEELQFDLDEIKELEDKIKKVKKPLLKFFNDMLYPFDSNKITERKGTLSDMRKLNASGLVTRHERIDKSTPDIYVLKNAKEYNQEAKKHPAKMIYKAFFNDYKMHMNILLELCAYFEDKKLRDSHGNIWGIYKSYKKR